MKDKFPLYEIINYKGNRYELVRACSLRAYHLILKKKEEQKEMEGNIGSSIKYKKDMKIQGIAMYDVLKNKIKFYYADKEKPENLS